jgi:hypothetical protein
MLRETERDEQIAAARRLPKEPVVQLPDAPVVYLPAANTAAASQAKVTESQIVPNTSAASAPAQVSALSTTATQVAAAKSAEPNRATAPADNAVPEPKSTAIATNQDPPVLPAVDVASALQNLVSSPTNVTATSLNDKQNATLTPVVDVAPKSDATAPKIQPVEPAGSIMEVSLSPETRDLKIGDKQQLQVRVKSDAPLGMAMVALRFDPKVLKINSVSMGDLFANARSAPTLTQSVDQHGMILVSITPAAGSAITADGALINLDVEALAAGESALAFDISNVHVVAGDGRPLLLNIEPVKLTVK